MHTHSADHALNALAARRHGVVTLAQLRSLGFSDQGIHRRVRAGRLRRLYRGVYSVGPLAPPRKERELAAVLGCGTGAALGWHSAGFAWGMVKRAPRSVHVICRRSRPPGPGVVVHRSVLAVEDLLNLDGVPTTTVARTIIDLADALAEDELADVVHESEVKRIFDLAQVEAAQARAPGRRGRHKLNRVLTDWRPEPFTRTKAERAFLAICRRHDLPPPRVNTWVGEQEVDFYWPQHKLVVEVDGGGAHNTHRAFVEDRRRDRRLAVRGIQVMRIAWEDRDAAGEEVAAVLSARSPC